MPLGTFTDSLMEARKRARLQGRPLSRNESAGIASGFANVASERTARSKSLKLREEQQAEQKYQYSQNLAQRRHEVAMEKEAADKSRKAQMYTGVASSATGAALLIGAGLVTNPVGWAIGGAGVVASLLGGGSWICTRTKDEVGFSLDEWRSVAEFREYAHNHHNDWFQWYLDAGQYLVRAMPVDIYDSLKTRMLMPVIKLTRKGKLETAYRVYKTWVILLSKQYHPALLEATPRRAA